VADDGTADGAGGALKRASPAVAMGILAGSFLAVVGVCVGVPLLLLLLFGHREAPRQRASAPPQKSAPQDKTKEQASQTKPAEKQAADYVRELDDADPKVRETALKALAKLKDESTFAAVAGRLKDSKDRRFASDALKAFGAAAEAEVDKSLQDPDKAVRLEACKILNKIGTKASEPLLQAAAKEKDKDVAKEAQSAIKEIGKRGS
jgi:HEAT repeat protein